MSQYRVRYSRKKTGQHHAADVMTLDVESELEHPCDHLPSEAYILYVEDLTHGQDVHWTSGRSRSVRVSAGNSAG